MTKSIFLAISLILTACTPKAQDIDADYARNWPQFRGPSSNGVALYGNPPTDWSESKNIKWKIEIPGSGHSSPIVWEQMVFVQTAVSLGENTEGGNPTFEFLVLAIDRGSGKTVWRTNVAREQTVDGTHRANTMASNSPVTDGKYLYAYFGSRGLHCLDFEGNIVWSRDLGQMRKKNNFGEGSSPALYRDRIVIQWDHERDSYMYVIDKHTGTVLHKIPRAEATTWSTPLITEVNGKAQVITSASSKMRSYDLETGEVVWESSGMVSNVIPHPIQNGDLVYLMSGYRGNALMAIDLTKAKGDISGTDAIIWQYKQHTSYTPSAALVSDRLYFLRANNGQLNCLDAKTGEVFYSMEELEGTGTIYASPVVAQDRIYMGGRNGITYVVKDSEQFEILARNELDDGYFATPAIAGNELFIRGFSYLYCISEE